MADEVETTRPPTRNGVGAKQPPAHEEVLPAAHSTVMLLDKHSPSVNLKSLSKDVPPPPPPGDIKKYHLVRPLGEGGMGKVFLVYDQDLRRHVALKTVRPELSKTMVSRFFNEAQVMGQLGHPNIVPVYDLGLTEGRRPFYVMPLVQGQTLEMILAGLRMGDPTHLRTFSLTRLMQIFLQLALAVDYAHAKGVVHRDIKPANVMIGEHGEVLLLDWGVAKVLGEGGVVTDLADQADAAGTPTATGHAVGTPLYMAPEQVLGDPVDARTDVYALGILLYEILTLSTPFRGSLADVFTAQIEQDPVAPRARAPERTIPLELERTCLKALRKKPRERHASARELHDEVQGWLEAASDKAKRHERAGKLAARGAETLDSYKQIKEEIHRLEEEVTRLRATFRGWQTVEEKTPLHEAENRVSEERRNLAQTASSLVMTLSAALGQDEEHPDARHTLAAYYWDRLVEAETEGDLDSRDYFEKLVAAYHDGKYEKELKGDGVLWLESSPSGAEVWLHRLVEDKLQLTPVAPRLLGRTPLKPVRLPMGSYLAVLKREGFADVRYPIWISRNRDWMGSVNLYTDEQIGDGYCYIPAGPFVLGGDKEVGAWGLPRSEPSLDDFFIARDPVTFAQYLDFLNALAGQDPEEALRHSPRRSPKGGSYLRQNDKGRLELPEEEATANHWGPRTPVVSISWHDAVAYCAWLSREEGCEVRLPTEQEWEKASRGVDGRWYPWGWRFDASLCNMRNSRREGAAPLPVDSYPTDVSVYGVRGTAGNVRDWTATILALGEEGDTRGIRGGAWNLPADISRSANRFWLSPSFVLNYVGLRVVRSSPRAGRG